MIGQKFSLSVLPDVIIKKRAYPTSELLWGRGLSRRNGGAGGQWAAGERVVDGAHGFRVVKISRVICGFDGYFSFGAEILTHA